ncbi:MAG: response regulator [Labilithrix sp.]|nr:response regulator [Labilithrix sp.]
MSGLPCEIVLVEDSDEDAELALRALKRQNLANGVHRLVDGAAALDFFFGDSTAPSRVPPRVVLLDLKLPKVSGLDVLRRLKSDERTRSVPVVVLTSSKEDRDLTEAYRLGANSYIVKPVEFANFAKAIETLGVYWMLVNEPPP